MPSFYRMQMLNESTGERVTEEVLAQDRITASEEYAKAAFMNLPPGTIIMVHKGSHPVALVETVARLIPGHGEEPSFGVDYRVKILSRFAEAKQIFPPLRGMPGNIVFQGTFGPVSSGSTHHYTKLWYDLIMQKAILDNYRALLEFKHQIILQGPPGTGKTRLAKLIADQMIKPRSLPRPLVDLEKFMEAFDPTQPEIKQQRAKRQAHLDEFQKMFPKDDLAKLPPDRYALGTGTKDTFCYWIQHKLPLSGKYDPGTSSTYLLYKRKGDQTTWVYRGNLLENIDAARVPMQEVAALLSALVEQRNAAESLQQLDGGFALKVLHSYHPQEYMPINEEDHLDNALRLLGESSVGMNAVEKNLRVQAIFEQEKQRLNVDMTNDEFKDFLDETFGLKEPSEVKVDELVARGACTLVQFHPAYTYEDFVRGIVAKPTTEGQVFYEVENKTLALLAQQALDQPKAKFVLIIDEINRANLPAVLGELIYALEYRYEPNPRDPDQPPEMPVQSMYPIKTGSLDDKGSREIRLPKNLYIIGTMNSADRSIGHLDYAIRRRFAFEDVLPSPEVLHANIADEAVRGKAVALYAQVAKLFERDNLAADYLPAQVQLGHSYFLAETEQALRLRLRYEIQPLLREYLRDGVLLPTAANAIDALHV